MRGKEAYVGPEIFVSRDMSGATSDGEKPITIALKSIDDFFVTGHPIIQRRSLGFPCSKSLVSLTHMSRSPVSSL